jgi:hypothetical protein
MTVVLYIDVEINGWKHCDNSCPFMDNTMDTAGTWTARCTLFDGTPLTWDKRRKSNGYKRCRECRASEKRE